MVGLQGLVLPLRTGGEGGDALPAPPLAARGLARAYGATRAVRSLDLLVRRGELAGLVGPNGSGKTTALRLVAGLERPDAGTVDVAGVPQPSGAARARLAYVPDEPGGLDELTIVEIVRLYGALHGVRGEYDGRAAVLLDAFALAGRASVQVGALSHGQRRAVAATCALALAPPLVLVDEATAALDPEAVVVLREALRIVAARGSGVLLATQDLSFAEQACDRVFLLADGALVASGPPARLRARYHAPSLERAFLAAVGHETVAEDLRRRLESL